MSKAKEIEPQEQAYKNLQDKYVFYLEKNYDKLKKEKYRLLVKGGKSIVEQVNGGKK